MTILQRALEVLEQTGRPMTCSEIWHTLGEGVNIESLSSILKAASDRGTQVQIHDRGGPRGGKRYVLPSSFKQLGI